MATSYGLARLLCFALMAAAASATQFRVGGAKGWSVPDGTVEPYNTWSRRMRFQIGDQLLFVYPKETDSVLLVDQASYNACNTTTYVTKFEGGNTVFTLDRSGPFFFISGNQASCAANQKLIVVVLAASHTQPGLSPPTPPSSMPPTSAAPVPSPSMAPPSPPSMPPPAAAPVPSPASPPAMAPPSGAPMPSPMSPPSGAPMPSPMSPPSGAPMPTPESAPSPTGSAPGSAPAAAPGSSPSSSPGTPGTPGSPPSSSPGTPGGVPQPPSDSNPPPSDGANSTTPGSGAAPLTAGLISTLAAGIGYAILAI